ncbi:MAG: hypothetical protein PF445_12020 [Melioribacteraceae bacterium]|jgi:hypothetical protein|nr:hypothetical protein [Melioribacteraceae bacterium]
MKTNIKLREQIFETIENQIAENEPPETKLTFNRLIKSGFSDFETKQLIGQCVAIEIFGILKNSKTFDEKRYLNNLELLPNEPIE